MERFRALMLLSVLFVRPAPLSKAEEKSTVPERTTGAKSSSEAKKTKPMLAEVVNPRIKVVLDELEKDGDFQKATAELRKLLGQVGAYATFGKPDPFVETAFALRLVSQLGDTGHPRGHRRYRAPADLPELDAKTRIELLKFLRANDILARALAFTVRADLESPEAIYALLAKLRGAYGAKLRNYAYLTAAVCVVHDRPLSRRTNTREESIVDPMAVFDFFVTHQNRMLFGVQKVPPELLIYAVDVRVSIKEMKWALGRYQGDRNVGRRYFNIKYDYDHFRKGTEKKVARSGSYNLPGILKYGGVCVDQAHFAASVGKSIGVPTCQIHGRRGSVGHAWVGFFQVRGKKGVWNLKYGRYEQYTKLRGVLEDPQTRQKIPDDRLCVQAELLRTSTANRYAAIAYVDAARLMADAGDSIEGSKPKPFDTDLRAGEVRTEPRKGDIASKLDLIERGLRYHTHGYVPGWLLLGELARTGEMDLAQKKYWASSLQSICGKEYPDFFIAVVKPMVETVKDIREQCALWDALYRFCRFRKDLAAEILMAEGEMWEKAGETKKAGKSYEQVLARHMNDGPFALTALEKTGEMLRELGKEKDVPRLYLAAWKKCRKPDKMAAQFTRYSNWFRVGVQFARILRDAGSDSQAAKVIRELESSGARVSF